VARDHVPSCPSWVCQACGREWPCPPARKRLVAEYTNGTALRMYLWLQLERAAEDLRGMTVEAMSERFIHWAWPEREQGT